MSQGAVSGLAQQVDALRRDLLGRVGQSLQSFGDVVVMTADASAHSVRDLVKRKFPVEEFLLQCWFIVTVAMIPMVLITVPIGVILSIQVGSLASQVGANSFQGAASGLGIIRQGAPMVTALMMAGAVGSAIAADLGARTIREEIDAMEVMGLPPARRLVAPRILAVMVMSAVMVGVVIVAGVLTGYVYNVTMQDGVPGSFVSTFASFARPEDMVLAVVKAVIFGLIVAAVACNRGLCARGGPRGVADAVNATVVLSVVLLFIVNTAMTQLYAIIVPPTVG